MSPQLYELVTGVGGEMSLLQNTTQESFVWLKVTIQGEGAAAVQHAACCERARSAVSQSCGLTTALRGCQVSALRLCAY
jgi:hypothetical protein